MTITILLGSCLSILGTLPDQSINTCVTSPPYFGLRDYGVEGQLGLEATPEEYVANLVRVFRQVGRVLRDDGTLWLNLGDSFTSGGRGSRAPDGKNPEAIALDQSRPKTPDGLKPKDLIGIPWMVAFALRADGWYLRQDIIWHKPNPMPESVRDRPTKGHEYLFLLSKNERYHYDAEAIREPAEHSSIKRWRQDVESQTGSTRANGGEKTNGPMKAVGGPRRSDKQRGHSRTHQGFNERWDGLDKSEQAEMGRNKRSVWTVATKPFSGAHFATYPPELVEPCILAGCPAGGVVLDPFFGAGTTGLVADRLGRDCIGIEINAAYRDIAIERLRRDAGMLADVVAA